MEDLAETAGKAAEILKDIELRRENAIKRSRDVLRTSKRMIHAIHTGSDPADESRILNDQVSSLKKDLGDDPMLIRIGPVEDAMMEYSEAMILNSIVKGESIPSFDSLGIRPEAWLLGLADTLGEMRRILLNQLMSEDVDAAKGIFSIMEEVYRTIIDIDVPDAVLPMRRKQDIARSVMERTRTDLTNAVVFSKR